MFRYKKHYQNRDITFFESLITEHSWWDSIDFIAPKIVGAHFLMFPEERRGKVDRWIKSGNIWLQRSAVLFQLKYKDKLDRELLSHIIHQLKDEKEFFIRKAIGWMLREYSKVDADWVQQFLRNTRLQPLSEREALKWIQRTNEEG
ncbi:MAG: DNA alkylation repair protein [Bacteroidota bacterium]